MGLRTQKPLNVHVAWTEMLEALDVPISEPVLPASLKCPLCNGSRLTIYDDTTSRGCWHYCFDCNHSGDMIELAAAVWDVPLDVAAFRIDKDIAPLWTGDDKIERIKEYAFEHTAVRHRAKAMIEEAGANYPKCHSDEIRRLRERFRLTTTMPQERWEAGPAHFIGVMPKHKVEYAFNPKFVTGRACQTCSAVFKGFGWRDVLVIPFEDVPGRAAVVLFVGRNGDKADRVYRAGGVKLNGPLVEGGFACAWAIEHSYATFDNHLIVCGDPFLALRIHIKHFTVARRPLPLVAYCDYLRYQTKNAWKHITKKPVLWGWRLTPSLLNQAILCDGMISISNLHEVTQAKIDHFVRDNEPKALMEKIIKKAKPWREALIEWADSVQDGAIEALVMGMISYKTDIAMLAKLHPRIASMAGLDRRVRTIRIDSYTLTERDGQWWASRKNEPSFLVMNAVMRITGTIPASHTSTDHGRYECKLIMGDVEVDFTVAVKQVSKVAIYDLQNTVALASPRSPPLYVAKQWGTRIYQAALAFGCAA